MQRAALIEKIVIAKLTKKLTWKGLA